MAAQPAVGVLDGDVGGEHLHLAGRADGEKAGLFAEPLLQGLHHGEVPLADEFALLGDGNAVLVHVQGIPAVFPGQPLDNQRLDAETGKHLGGGAAGIALLDTAGERALGAGRKPAGVGAARTAQKTRCEDQLVVFAQGVTGGYDLAGNDAGGKGSAAETCPLLGHFFSAGAQTRHVHAYNLVHVCFLPFAVF